MHRRLFGGVGRRENLSSSELNFLFIVAVNAEKMFMVENYYTIFLLKGKEFAPGGKKVIYYILIIASNIVVSSLSIIVCNFPSYLIATRHPSEGDTFHSK